MEIGVVIPPDKEYQNRIMTLLAHKPGNFQFHLREAFAGTIQGLETRFYLGVLDGHPVCNVMTVEADGVGILGHVFTRPEQRRKGACAAVMGVQMADFRKRGGQALYLGTGFESPPYWIYHRFGFRSITGDSGFMRYISSEAFEAVYFALAQTTLRDVKWGDWVKLNVLFAIQGDPYLRNLTLGRFGISNFEGGFLSFYKAYLEREDYQANALVSSNGAVVGFASLIPDSRWQEQSYLFDVFLHPNFLDTASRLVGAFTFPAAKIQAHVETTTPSLVAELQNWGFVQEAVLKNQMVVKARGRDVVVMARTV